MIAGLAVIVYYLHGFSPISPDDMTSLNAAVSLGIHNVSSEQASLGQSSLCQKWLIPLHLGQTN